MFEFFRIYKLFISSIRVGVGIHSGPVIMGIVGDSLRMDTTVISDTVNIASCIEGLKSFWC